MAAGGYRAGGGAVALPQYLLIVKLAGTGGAAGEFSCWICAARRGAAPGGTAGAGVSGISCGKERGNMVYLVAERGLEKNLRKKRKKC